MMRRVVGATLALWILVSPAVVWAQSPVSTANLSSANCPGTGCVTLGVAGLGGVGVQITGTWVATVTFEASIDGQNFSTLNVLPITGAQTAVTTTTGNGVWAANVSGLTVVRVRISAYTSGFAAVTLRGASASGR